MKVKVIRFVRIPSELMATYLYFDKKANVAVWVNQIALEGTKKRKRLPYSITGLHLMYVGSHLYDLLRNQIR